jgi:tryptophan 2-monooxygenase
LLARAAQTAIAQNQYPDLRIAVVGAGMAGLTAARELFRCGYTNIDIFEASDRIGGRNYSIPAPDRLTTYEMGAMRMPFFTQPGAQNCVLDYYRNLFGITTQPFPDPGSAATASTGIYINDGRGPDRDEPPRLL